MQNLNIGTPGASASVVQSLPLSGSGIRVSLTTKPSKITINNIKVQGTADGISISRGQGGNPTAATLEQTVTISNSEIFNVRRDAISVKDVGHFAIFGNSIHDLHPNYEKFQYNDNWPRGARNAILLPDGSGKADHADGIQVTSSMGGTISGNRIYPGQGAWFQGIFVHHEPNSFFSRDTIRIGQQEIPLAQRNIAIQNNIIQNNHLLGIRSRHYGSSHLVGNTLSHAKTQGRSDTITPQSEVIDLRKQ